MKRLSLLCSLRSRAVALCVGGCLLWLFQSSAAAKPPNIVFILADDLGYGDLGCYGHPYARTPNLDRLASEGTRFTQFRVTGVTCCPSRTGFMTSRHPASFPKYMSDFGFGGRVTVTELLNQAGYRTGHFGKWHIGPDEPNGTYGIDEVGVKGSNKADPGGRDAGLFRDAIRFIERNRDKPFYVNVWGHITHFPVGPEQSLVDEFKDLEFNRADFGGHMQEKFEDALELQGDLADGMRNYLGDVWSLDLQVGALLTRLDQLGLRDNTIVVFSSDQGPAPVKLAGGKSEQPERRPFSVNMLGYAGGFRGGKHTQFEGGVRSPFIIRWPGNVPAGKVNETSVTSGLDWLPTLCAIAGVKIDAAGQGFEGQDVSDIWRGSDRSPERPLFWKVSSAGAKVSALDGRWKFHEGARGSAQPLLYDLSTDPKERTNLAGDHPDIVKRMETLIAAWSATLPEDYEKAAAGKGKQKAKARRKAKGKRKSKK